MDKSTIVYMKNSKGTFLILIKIVQFELALVLLRAPTPVPNFSTMMPFAGTKATCNGGARERESHEGGAHEARG